VLATLLWAAALAAPFMADALVLFGVLVMTLGVYGVVRMPDTYSRQHAASKMVFLGVITLLLASALP
jgi:multicomponent Na+:H+ antiporter subunit G